MERTVAGDAKAEDVDLRGVLENKSYLIDFYQRDYSWDKKQVHELLNDLYLKFTGSYSTGDIPDDVGTYKQYFLGSYVLSKDASGNYSIIDGQQRLTTLTLLFLYFHHYGAARTGQQVDAINYLWSNKRGRHQYNIQAAERKDAMDFLVSGQSLEEAPKRLKESALVARYTELVSWMEETFQEAEELEVFYYWLIERVWMVRILTHDDTDAYEIFESMNDRGKPLTKLDMLKGYLLALVEDERRPEAVTNWKMMENLLGDEADQFIRDLFHAKWAKTTPQSVLADSEKNDWGEINVHYYRWLKTHSSRAGLTNEHGSAAKFIQELLGYAGLYKRLRSYMEEPVAPFEEVSNLWHTGAPQLMVPFLGLIGASDSAEDVKVQVIAKYLSIKNALQAWNGVDFLNDANVTSRYVSLLNRIRDVLEDKGANVDVDELISLFLQDLDRVKETFDVTSKTVSYSKGVKKKRLFSILAALTSYLENVAEQGARKVTVASYYQGKYDIEHVLAAEYEVNSPPFTSQEQLEYVRNKIGVLGLLPEVINRSLNDAPYSKKVDAYVQHNRLLGTFSKQLYANTANGQGKTFQNHPHLNRFLQDYPHLQPLLKPYSQVDTVAVAERSRLYGELCKVIWNKEDLLRYNTISPDATQQDLQDVVERSLGEEVSLPKAQKGKKEGPRYLPGALLFYVKTLKDGSEASVEAEAVQGNKVIITKIRNAPTADNYSLAGKAQFESSRAVYEELQLGATTEHPGRYSWEGESTPVAITKPLFLLAGNPVANTWVEKM